MIVKNLGGGSGCTIYLIEEDGIYFVRKFSASVNYNNRLIEQCNKQRNFNNLMIKTPKVLNEGYQDGLYFFDMEYIQGITLAKYLTKCNVNEISDIAESIIQNIDFNDYGFDSSIFTNKIIDLENKTKTLDNVYITKAIDYLKNVDWSNFKISNCHGDLTLENIIIRNGNMYYIDFLDSFYNSWLIDFGKLLQDVESMWSYRKESIDVNLKLRLIILKSILINKLKEINTKYVKDAYIALLLNLVRIYPYTKDEFTFKYLDREVEKILRLLEAY